jgi:hypothetical protein
MKVRYVHIVFLQGDEAVEALELLDRAHEEQVIEYLRQWETGDEGGGELRPPWGTADSYYEDGPYIVSYNRPLGYIGLCRTEHDD